MTVQDCVKKHISKKTMEIDNKNKIAIRSQSLKSVNINLI